jgi:macrolide transport system ATP-binding/permease protein
LSALLRDVRFGVRLLSRNPLFTLVAALSLGLGVGANTALFSMFNALLWRPLSVDAPGQLVAVYSRSLEAPFYDAFPWLEYKDYESAQVFDGLAAFTVIECAAGTRGADATRIYGEVVSGNYFDVLRPAMALGRAFRADEGADAARAPVVVIGYQMWQRRFHGDAGVVGRTMLLNNQAVTIAGVAAKGFRGAYAIYFSPDVWVPIPLAPRLVPAYTQTLESRDAREFRMLGRLRPGMTIAQANAAVRTVASRLESTYPQTNRGIRAFAFRELDTRPEVEIAGTANTVALLFLGLTGLVLLVACANVANLLLARSAARRKEIAMRTALGASRAQLVRQLLVESVLLALLAGAVGLAVGSAVSGLVASIRVPTDLPLVFEFPFDARVILFTLGTSLAAGLAFGLLPALRASRGDLVPALKSSYVRVVSRRRFTLANALVVAQVAASLVLLVVAGLCVRSIGGARTIDPGFRTDHRVMLSFSPALVGYDDSRSARFYRVLMERVRQLPTVEDATVARYVPLDFSSSGGDVIVEGRPADGGKNRVQVLASRVDEQYFRTLGTPIVRGRTFTAADTELARPVLIVNEQMARETWPGQDPIGKRLQYDIPNGPFLEVVGVAADGKYRGLTESPRRYLFLPFAQHPVSRASVVVSYRGDLDTTVAALRREVASIDPAMPIFETKTMDQHMDRAMMGPRLSASLVGPAGLLAALIAAIGLYGVMAYSVSRRTQEIGIRVAVGAGPGEILSLVMRQGLMLSAVGVGLGVAAALASSTLVSVLLFGVSPTDPVVFTGVPLLLGAVSALACYIPARRAMSVDPLTALRQE